MIASLPAEILEPVAELSSKQKKAYVKSARGPIKDAFLEFFNRMNQYREQEYISPIRDTLELLPVSELAAVAETLLNASQIHKRVNPEMETVGVPVDVAVISKGDRFIWIKRKHYFDPHLNPIFAQKYLKDD